MKIEEAMVYLLATSQHGMKTEQIARELELRGLVPPRRDGRPLDGKVIAAIVFKHPEVFCFNGFYGGGIVLFGCRQIG